MNMRRRFECDWCGNIAVLRVMQQVLPEGSYVDDDGTFPEHHPLIPPKPLVDLCSEHLTAAEFFTVDGRLAYRVRVAA